jgi:hypothetical protein
MKLVKSIALAVGVAAAAVSAHAAATPDDLILGFKLTGAANNVQIDLGSLASFDTNASYSSTVNGAFKTYNLGNVASILTTNLASNWSTATFGVVGTETPASGNVINWVDSKWTKTTGTLGVANSGALGTVSDSVAGGTNSNIAAVYGNTYTANGIYSVAVVPTSAASSWSKNDPFGFSAAKIDTGLANGKTDLYTAASDGSTATYNFLGTFALGTDGSLSYTTAFTAIPEPSTYAMILGALTIGFVALRRRFSKAV